MKAGIEWCAALLWFLLVFGLKDFSPHPISTLWKQDWVMCCSCDSFLYVWS
jgi:hypothetical protein